MYILTSAGAVKKYPYSIAELRHDNPQTSFPRSPSNTMLAEWGVFPVEPVPQPSADHTKNLAEGTPEQIGDFWFQTWVITDATPEQIAERTSAQSDAMRAERNERLSASDWTQLPDAPVGATAWAAYRQALRDVTSQTGFPWNVVWPEPPA